MAVISLVFLLLRASNKYEWQAENGNGNKWSNERTNNRNHNKSYFSIPIPQRGDNVLAFEGEKKIPKLDCFIFLKWIFNITLIIQSNKCGVTMRSVVRLYAHSFLRQPKPTIVPRRTYIADLWYFYCFDCRLLCFGHCVERVFFPIFQFFGDLDCIVLLTQWQGMPHKRINIHNLSRMDSNSS